MTGDTPDYRRFTAGKVRSHRLAQAARSQPAPVRLESGHFAPPHTRAVWHLPVVVCGATEVLQILWREEGDVFTLRIVPMGGEA